jgi:hypothetical protein
MKATEFLKQDHVAVRRLIDEVIASPDARRRQELIGSLATAPRSRRSSSTQLFPRSADSFPKRGVSTLR